MHVIEASRYSRIENIDGNRVGCERRNIQLMHKRGIQFRPQLLTHGNQPTLLIPSPLIY